MNDENRILDELVQIRRLLERMVSPPPPENGQGLPGVAAEALSEVEAAFASYGKQYRVTERRAAFLRRFLRRTKLKAPDLPRLVHGCVAAWGGIDRDHNGFCARQALTFEAPFRDERVDTYLEAYAAPAGDDRASARARVAGLLQSGT